MKFITELIVRTADLIEAEGRALRAAVVRLGGAGVLIVSSALLALAGLAVILLGVYRILAELVGAPWASIIVGLVCLALSGALLWMTRRRLSR